MIADCKVSGVFSLPYYGVNRPWPCPVVMFKLWKWLCSRPNIGGYREICRTPGLDLVSDADGEIIAYWYLMFSHI